MARYVGDLTAPENSEEREKAAALVNQLVRAIRNRKVRHLSVSYDRLVVSHGFGSPMEVGPWEVKVQVERRGRHER